MPGQYSVRNLRASHPAVIEMANVCANEDDISSERRADSNETSLVAQSLTSVALDALTYDYAELAFRRLAPLQEGLSPGTESYRWDELDWRGMAKIIENYADDLPDVSAYIKSNTGTIKSIGDAFQYTKQDIRRVMEARRQGRQSEVLDVDRVVQAREFIERKKDVIAAYGDTKSGLPGVLKNVNVTLLTASTPASGTSKKWTGGHKSGAEVLKDFRTLMSAVRVQSKGIHTVTTIVAPIEEIEAVSVMPLLAGSDNQITVLQQFLTSQRDMGRPITIIPWNRCATADAAGTGPRVLAYQNDARVLRLVEPLDFEADPPQRVNFSFKVPCESRYGSIYWRRPLAGAFMDFV